MLSWGVTRRDKESCINPSLSFEMFALRKYKTKTSASGKVHFSLHIHMKKLTRKDYNQNFQNVYKCVR